MNSDWEALKFKRWDREAQSEVSPMCRRPDCGYRARPLNDPKFTGDCPIHEGEPWQPTE